jgi:hypothetical protein
MKKLITTIILLVMTLPILAQEKVVEHIDGNLYSYKKYEDGKVAQRGYYKNLNGTLFEHGIWKDSFGTTALFEDGKMLWIKPKGEQKYTYEQIQLHRLKRRVAMLEQKLTSL